MTESSLEFFFSLGPLGLLIFFGFFALPPFLGAYLLAWLLRTWLGWWRGLVHYLCFLAGSCLLIWHFYLRGIYQACLKCTIDVWPSEAKIQAMKMGYLVTWALMMTVFYLVVLFVEMQRRKFSGGEQAQKR